MTHKKYHRIRLATMVCSTIIIVAWLVFGILALVGSEDLSATFEKAIPVIVIFGIVDLILLLLFGRIFCGFFCPLGFFQDVIWKMTEKLHLPRRMRLPRCYMFRLFITWL